MSAGTVEDDPLVTRRGLTREWFEALVGTGALDGVPVELLEGVLVEVVPQGWEHHSAVTLLNRWLSARVPPSWLVAVQGPLAAGPRSEPEPDLAVVQLRRGALPDGAALVVEVASSTHRTDLVHKPRIYAAAGVPAYWVVDLRARQAVVHTSPVEAGYAVVERLPWTTPVSAVVDGEVLTLLLSEVLTDLT